MGAKRIAFDDEAREAIRRGVARLAKAVKVTLGPRGRNVMIERGIMAPLVTKDGVTVAKELEFEDSWEDMGAQMVKEVASKTSDAAGDGTTTATVLAEAIFERGLRALRSGVQPVLFRRGIERAAACVVAELGAMSEAVRGRDHIAQVGTIAANNDPEIGEVLAKAMDKVGKDGVITVDEGHSLQTEVEFVDGMSFDRGYLSPYFVTDTDGMLSSLEDARILISSEKISSVQDLVPVLEAVLTEEAPLLIVADDLEGEALALLVVNKLRGTLKVCAVKAPGFGDDRKARLEDLATLTGGRVVSKETGVTLENLGVHDLGKASKVVVRKDQTEIVGGGGDAELVKVRLEQLRAQVSKATSSYDSEKIEERIAKLAGGVARVLVGAATEPEMKEKKARIEDAIHATRAAAEAGIVPGGGVALLRASRAIRKLGLTGDEELGARIVQEALAEPIRHIASNAGYSPAVVVEKVLAAEDPSYGLNALTGEYCDLKAAGVIDPTKVSRTAFENAVSVATMLLTTDCIVGEPRVASSEGGDEGDEDWD
ncbi:MAG: chaperonin GroEL [Planctomycetota bacterium]